MTTTNGGPDDLSAAVRALTKAAAGLARAVGDQVNEVKPQVADAVTTGLRQAAESLASVTPPPTTGAAQRRAKKAEETRAKLLDAAADVIAAKGYEGASMEDIAAAAGFTKGALYSHFSSKEDLLFALATEHLATAQGLPEEGQLPAAIGAMLCADGERRERLLALELMSSAMRIQSFRDWMAPQLQASLDVVAQQVAANRGVKPGPDGTVEVAPEDREAAIGVLALVNMGQILADLAVSDEAGPEVNSHLVERLLRP
jgi:AcrR family transcriptional regulator